MKDFFKNVLATIVGVFVSAALLGGLGVILIVGLIGLAMGSSSSDTFNLKDNTVLTLNLKGIMKDRVILNPLSEYLGLSETNEIALVDILDAIKKAKENNNIKGIYIYSGYLSAPTASLTEIRASLLDFKKSGKFIVAYSDTYTQGGYYLSSVADKVVVNPQGMLDLHGLAVNPTFYKGTLDKLGIDIQVFKVGTYKSAVEPFIEQKMSEANKEQVRSFTNSMWETILNGISSSRKIPASRLNTLADTFPLLQDSAFIRNSGLVDDFMYETEVKAYLKTLMNVDSDDKLNTASISDMTTVPYEHKTKTSDRIAILYAEGSIVSGTNNTEINDRYFVREIEKIAKNDDVKAVVFRVNSPGGSAYASEQIWKAITDLKAVKPVVVSMGSYAASGGYYISCNATKIYAEPTTLTGSIGIFGMFPNIEGLTNKIGLNFDQVTTNKFSDFGDMTRPLRADEKALLQNYIERGYSLFLKRCAEGRGMSIEQMGKIAQGRVWTGEQALQIGLVDAIGGIDAAVKEAAMLAEMSEYQIKAYPALPNPFEVFLNFNKEEISERLIKTYLGSDFDLFKKATDIKKVKDLDFVQAVMPYNIEL